MTSYSDSFLRAQIRTAWSQASLALSPEVWRAWVRYAETLVAELARRAGVPAPSMPCP